MYRLPYNPLIKAKFQGKKTNSLGVIGHIAIDTIVHPNFVLENSPGGSAAAIATAAVQLGVETSIYSKVGKDFPKEWLRVLESLGIDISGVDISDKEKSLHVKMIYGEKGGTENIECNDEAFNGLSVKSVPKTDCIHICPVHPENQLELVSGLKGSSTLLSLSFSEFFIEDYQKKDFLGKMSWKDVDIVFANEKEAKAITKGKSPEDMAHEFHDKGVGLAVITLGEKGSLVFDGSDFQRTNAREVNVIDTTGCGDSYIGGFLGEYLSSKDVRKAAGMGTYLASLTAQKKGSWAALLSDVGVRF